MLQDDARRRTERALHPLRARPCAGRLLLHQRHDLHARPARGLRPLGFAGQPRLVLGRGAALLHQDRRLRTRRERAARRRRRVARRGAARVLGNPRRLARGGGRVRHPEHRRVQPGRQQRLRLLPDEPAPRRALERDQGLFTTGTFTQEPHRHDRGDGDACTHRKTRRRASRERHRVHASAAGCPLRRGKVRNHPRRRLHQLAATAAALGHRAGNAAVAIWHIPAAGPARRGRKPARPPANPPAIQGQQHHHAQRACQQSHRQGGDGARVPAVQDRANDHAALAAGRLRQERPGAANAQHRMACATAVPG